MHQSYPFSRQVCSSLLLVGLLELGCGRVRNPPDDFPAGEAGGKGVGDSDAETGSQESTGGMGSALSGGAGGSLGGSGGTASGGAGTGGLNGEGDGRCVWGEFDEDAGEGLDCKLKTECQPGSYVVDPGSYFDDRVCQPCRPSAYTDEANLPACRDWTDCPLGKASSVAPSSTHNSNCDLTLSTRTWTSYQTYTIDGQANVHSIQSVAYQTPDVPLTSHIETVDLAGLSSRIDLDPLEIDYQARYLQMGPSGGFYLIGIEIDPAVEDVYTDFHRTYVTQVSNEGDLINEFYAPGSGLSSVVSSPDGESIYLAIVADEFATVYGFNSEGTSLWPEVQLVTPDGSTTIELVVSASGRVFGANMGMLGPTSLFEVSSTGTFAWTEPTNLFQGVGLAVGGNTLVVADQYAGGGALHAYDLSGTPIWTRDGMDLKAGLGDFVDVAVAGDGSVFLLSLSEIQRQVSKLSPDGQLQWTQPVTTSAKLSGYDLMARDAGVYFVGYGEGLPFAIQVPEPQ